MGDIPELNTPFNMVADKSGSKRKLTIRIPEEIEQKIISGPVLFCIHTKSEEELEKEFFIITIQEGRRRTPPVRDFCVMNPIKLALAMETGTLAIPEKASKNLQEGCALVVNDKYCLLLCGNKLDLNILADTISLYIRDGVGEVHHK